MPTDGTNESTMKDDRGIEKKLNLPGIIVNTQGTWRVSLLWKSITTNSSKRELKTKYINV